MKYSVLLWCNQFTEFKLIALIPLAYAYVFYLKFYIANEHTIFFVYLMLVSAVYIQYVDLRMLWFRLF